MPWYRSLLDSLRGFARAHKTWAVLVFLLLGAADVGLSWYLSRSCSQEIRSLAFSIGLLGAALVVVLLSSSIVRRWVAVVAAALLLVDWVGCFGARTLQPISLGAGELAALHYQPSGNLENPSETEKKLQAHKQLESEQRRSFLKAQYDTAVKELEQRADNEKTLFILKFSLVGAILGALFILFKTEQNRPHARDLRQSSLVAAFFWAAVLVAATLDVRMQFNVIFITKLGEWVIRQEQALLVEAADLGWEHFLSGMFHSGFYPLIRMSATLLTVILFAVTVALFAPRPGGRTTAGDEAKDEATLGRELGYGGGLAAFVMFALVSRSFQTDGLAWVHAGGWAGVGYLSLFLSVRDRSTP